MIDFQAHASSAFSERQATSMLSLFDLLAALVTLTAAFAWLNFRFLKLPANAGLLLMGLAASCVLVATEVLFPTAGILDDLRSIVHQVDFYEAVMHGMLAFLLFAGALHVDMDQLRERAPVVGVLATIGVIISAGLIAAGLWAGASLLGTPITFAWALVFGILIAPTDPVTVLATLKSVDVPETLRTDLSGEALFNDGIAVVLFTVALGIASRPGDGVDAFQVLRHLVVEAGGGAVLGSLTGFLAYRALRSINDYSTEVLITLALVMGTYTLAGLLHVSGPISVVVAGVIIGNRGADYAMSDLTKRYVFGFWTLVDDGLNAILFLLIGLEVLVLNFEPRFGWIALIAIPLVVSARLVAVSSAISLLRRWKRFATGTIPILTWGGVRGGISVALALVLPASSERSLILTITYAVVLFTIIVQSLSLGWLIKRSLKPNTHD